MFQTNIVRPKILLFFEYGTLNGGEFSLLAILERLGQTQFEFVAAAPPVGLLTERLEQCHIPVLPLMLRDSQNQKRSMDQINAHLKDLITQVAPDLIHSNSLAMGRMVGRIVTQVSMPCTTHLRDIIKLNKTAIADLNQNTGLIAVSHATRSFHVEQGMTADRVQTIHNGVNTDLFCPTASTGTLKQALGLHDNAMLLANIGQICLRKGQTLLAEAAVSLANKFPEANYLFIGERHSQKQESIEYEQSIHRTFQDAGKTNHLFCLGFRQDIPSILNEVDLLVHTAHQEPLGRVLLEATACGQAIVATDVGGTSEILEDQTSALLVPPGNLEALTDAMEQMLTQEDLRIRLGQQARTQAVTKFALSTTTENTRQFWNSFL